MMKRLFSALAIVIFGAGAGRAEDCAPPGIDAPLAGPVRSLERVTDYEIVLQGCARAENSAAKLAIRTMRVEGEALLLLVDPLSLATHLERAACWTCGEARPELSNSRYLLAVEKFARDKGSKLPPGTSWLENAGLTHGRDKAGVFVTGDLCPSLKPLDRAFLQEVEKEGAAPAALSITGAWISRHKEDFLWLRREKAERRLKILWANHSFRHPFRLGLSNDENFILTPDIEPQAEILNLERLLIANGETPSVFFRYPGLISNSQWSARLREAHLIPLGADSWLALGQRPGPGGVILVHPNGNEPAGLSAFEKLNHSGALPKPLRDLTEAP
jgi:hypothetical protein